MGGGGGWGGNCNLQWSPVSIYIYMHYWKHASHPKIWFVPLWYEPPPPPPPPTRSFLILSEIIVLLFLYLSVLMNSAETLAERKPNCHVFFLVVLLHLIRLSVNCVLWCPQNKFFVLKEKKCLILSSGGPIKVYTWCVVYIVLFFVLVIPSAYTFSVYFTLFYS